MNKKNALTPIGMAIAIVVLLGVVMILSAPMLVDTSKTTKKPVESVKPMTPEVQAKAEQDKRNQQLKDQQTSLFNQLQSQLNYLELRVSNLESAVKPAKSQPSSPNQYNCTLEGVVDANGNTVPMSQVKTRTPDTKFVFVCGQK